MSLCCREPNTHWETKAQVKEKKKKVTLYPKSGMAFLSQFGGTLSDGAELEELCDVTLKERFEPF